MLNINILCVYSCTDMQWWKLLNIKKKIKKMLFHRQIDIKKPRHRIDFNSKINHTSAAKYS